MERDAQILIKAAEEYHLRFNGIKFWTPYWINVNQPPYFAGAPYNAKATPGQLRRVLDEKLAATNAKPANSEAFRRFMRQNGLGIDCSGLAYQLLATLLRQQYHLKLSDYIYAPKAEILKFSRRPRWQRAGVSRATLDRLPDSISLTKLHQLFGVNPRWNANVNRLSSDQTALTVKSLADARPGDMIKLSGVHYPHLGIVVKAMPERITYVDSSREWGQFGGVRFVDIKIKHTQAGLERQEWADKRFFFPDKGDRLCRLRVIDAQG